MKFYTPFITLLAGIALASPASATLLVGYHNFDTGDGLFDPNAFAGGITSTIDRNGIESRASGGSTTGSYGDLLNGPTVPQNDGYLRIFTGLNSGSIFMSVTNNRATSIPLAFLLFDAASQAAGQEVGVFFSIGGGDFMNLGIADSLPASGDDLESAPYGEYSFSLVGTNLLSGQEIIFRFDNLGGGVRLDNVALTAIPEPANALALALLLSSGVMLRNRRRKA